MVDIKDYLVTYSPKTSLGEYNLIWCIIEYFDKLYGTYADETQTIYAQRYRDSIAPCINENKPAKSYNADDIEGLLFDIQENKDYEKISMSSDFSHLIYRPIKMFLDKNGSDDEKNKFWGTSLDYSPKENEDIQSSTLLIKKSLDRVKEIEADKFLNRYDTDEGRDLGLAVMFYSGTRNAEACGLNFGDIREFVDHPDSHYLVVFETTEIKSNRRKLGGKTANAARNLPIVSRLADLLLKRKEFIEKKISSKLPYTNKAGITFKTIDDLPIACRGNDYFEGCSADDLTSYGRGFLKDTLKLNSKDVSKLSYLIDKVDKDTEYDLGEKDPTTYLLRRNFATHLYTLGLSIDDCQYYMGHSIDSGISRSDRNDLDYLYSLWLKLDKYPFNEKLEINIIDATKGYDNMESSSELIIAHKKKKRRYSISISNFETNDVIKLYINNTNGIIAEEKFLNKKNRQTVDITSIINKTYK